MGVCEGIPGGPAHHMEVGIGFEKGPADRAAGGVVIVVIDESGLRPDVHDKPICSFLFLGWEGWEGWEE